MTDFSLIDQSGADADLLRQQRQQYALQFEREKTALKYYLLGKNYHLALKALAFIEQLEFRLPVEERFRKDNATPSLHHQVRIALSVTQLKGLTDEIEELAITASLLHDCQEDHGVSVEEIQFKFGERVSKIVWKLTKKFVGQHKNKEEYIRDIAQDIVASLVKGLDRNDNLSTMIDVFTVDKMDQYADEAKTVFLPMLKTASKLFPELLHAYQSISQKMKLQINFTKKFVKLARATQGLEDELSQAHLKLSDADTINVTLYNQTAELHNQTAKFNSRLSLIETEQKQAKKQTFMKVASILKSCEVKGRFDMIEIMSAIASEMGISTLELTEFTEDRFSNGQTAATWLQDRQD